MQSVFLEWATEGFQGNTCIPDWALLAKRIETEVPGWDQDPQKVVLCRPGVYYAKREVLCAVYPSYSDEW